MEKHVIYPEKIYLVLHDRIMDGTVTTIDDIKTDPSAYLVPNRGEEGVALNITEEGVDIRERGPSGAMVHKKTLRDSFGFSFTINVGRWNLALEGLLRGRGADAVKDDQTASIEAADDATVTGLEFVNGIDLDEFAALFEMPEEKASGDRLYYYIPKCSRMIGDREQSMNVEQQNSQLAMRALALEDDEVTEHQAIYSGVSAADLYFPFHGKVDVV